MVDDPRSYGLLDVNAHLDGLELEAMTPAERHEARRMWIERTPLGRAAQQVLGGECSASGAFVSLLSALDLASVQGATALLESCLTLSNDWEVRGDARRAAAMLGVLLRLGIATADEWLIVHSTSRLHNVLKRHPETAQVSMEPGSLRDIRRAWCRADLRSSGAHPVQLQPIQAKHSTDGAPLHRVSREAELESFWGEVVMYERLVTMDERRRPAEVSPLAVERAVLRLLQMYVGAPHCSVEVCIRGLELLVLWSMVCVPSSDHSTRAARVCAYGETLCEQLNLAGIENARTMIEERLEVVVRVLQGREGLDSDAFQSMLVRQRAGRPSRGGTHWARTHQNLAPCAR